MGCISYLGKPSYCYSHYQLDPELVSISNPESVKAQLLYKKFESAKKVIHGYTLGLTFSYYLGSISYSY